MEDVTRKRVLRLLEGLPDEQLYQVLDYIEFVAAKYAAAAARKPDAFQRFAERVEDQMRVRSLAPKAMKGTMKIMSTASRVLDGVRDISRDIVTPPAKAASPSTAVAPATPPPTETARGASRTAAAPQARRPRAPSAGEGENGRKNEPGTGEGATGGGTAGGGTEGGGIKGGAMEGGETRGGA